MAAIKRRGTKVENIVSFVQPSGKSNISYKELETLLNNIQVGDIIYVSKTDETEGGAMMLVTDVQSDDIMVTYARGDSMSGYSGNVETTGAVINDRLSARLSNLDFASNTLSYAVVRPLKNPNTF